MKTEYPNLPLIEHIFIEQALQLENERLRDARFSYCQAEVFLQKWPNTAGGFDKPGTVSGQAFTDMYTTIMEMRWYLGKEVRACPEKDVIYGVFFGNRMAYLVIDPTELFFEDRRNRNMASVANAKDRY